MDDRHLGFLIPYAIIAGVITLLLTLGLYLTRGGLLFSPGPLDPRSGATLQGVTSHAELSGQCSACHGKLLDNSTMDRNCETCHEDVSNQRNDPTTLHGNLAKKNSELDCRSCHQEHGGLLTDLSKADVAHDWFGYSLEGHQKKASGAGFECKDCHTQDITIFAAETCSKCHEQVGDVSLQDHIQAYGENCLACHDGVDRYGKHFDHNQFSF